MLGFELEEPLALDIDELVYDYEPLESGPDGANLLCAAVDKEWFAGFLGELQAADIDPKVVTLDAMAYAHLYASLNEGEESAECVALVDVGHVTTSVTVVQSGQVRTARTIAKGGHHVTSALMHGFDIDYAKAETIKHTRLRLDGHLPPEVSEAEHAKSVEPREQAGLGVHTRHPFDPPRPREPLADARRQGDGLRRREPHPRL